MNERSLYDPPKQYLAVSSYSLAVIFFCSATELRGNVRPNKRSHDVLSHAAGHIAPRSHRSKCDQAPSVFPAPMSAPADEFARRSQGNHRYETSTWTIHLLTLASELKVIRRFSSVSGPAFRFLLRHAGQPEGTEHTTVLLICGIFLRGLLCEGLGLLGLSLFLT